MNQVSVVSRVRSAATVVGGVAASVVSGVAAAAAPTTAVGLAGAVDLADAQGAAMVIAGLLISMGVVLWGVRLVMSKFRPKV